MSQNQKRRDVKEGIIIFGVMTGLFLPVRMLFYTYISTNWFGSFGLISIISVILVVLVKKQKLGKFGEMFERQMHKTQHGKRSIIVYGQTIFFMIILGGNILAIELGNSYYVDIKNQLYSEVEGIDNPEKILAASKELETKDWILGLIGFFLAIFLAFPQVSASLAVLNDTFGGWPLHFYTVAFVESLEVFAMLIIFRIKFKKNNLVSLTWDWQEL